MDFWEFLPFGPYTAPAVSEKKRSELRMNRRCGRWKCIYGFLTLLVFSVLYGDSRQLGVAKRNLTEYGAKKKILFFIYFDIINLTKLLENING